MRSVEYFLGGAHHQVAMFATFLRLVCRLGVS